MVSRVLSRSSICNDPMPQPVEEIELKATVADHSSSEVTSPQSFQVTVAENEVEQAPATIVRYETSGFASILFFIFLMGWNDGTQGPLLPAIQAHYHVISLSLNAPTSISPRNPYTDWIYHCINHFCMLLCSKSAALALGCSILSRLQGFLIGSFLNVYLTNTLGFGKVIVLGKVDST